MERLLKLVNAAAAAAAAALGWRGPFQTSSWFSGGSYFLNSLKYLTAVTHADRHVSVGVAVR